MPADLLVPACIAAAVAAACLVLSWVFREYSWVDRTWSIVPPVYVAAFAHAAGWQDARLNLLTALTVAWGARLTFNYARKGGYAPGGEDYRWSILKARMPRWAWELFNVGFIAGYQHFLLFLLALPAWYAARHPAPLGLLDGVAAAGFVILLVGETIADQQQWVFQEAKRARRERGEGGGPGFLTAGLWAWSRHPNFFCEQGQWWMVYLFGVAASGEWLNLTIVGPVLLTLLFDGSARFTEWISAGKYPEYRDYQRRVSRMVPMPPRAGA